MAARVSIGRDRCSELPKAYAQDATEALELASLHPRVDLLSPGIGVGGHCIPIDPWFLHLASQQGASLIAAARTINDMRQDRAASRIATELDGIRPSPRGAGRRSV
jgi:UDP-N-acetyl-D-mannosaminuronic acid dehydrogenase